MTQPWTHDGSIASHAGPTVTLVGETSFCLSGTNGDVIPGSAQGLFFLDTRFLSHWELLVDDHPVETLATADDEPSSPTFAVRPTAGRTLDPAILVLRRRQVGRGMVEHIEVRNFGMEPVAIAVTVVTHADFADLFEVKEQRISPNRANRVEIGSEHLRFSALRDGIERRTSIACTPAPTEIDVGRIVWRLEIPAGERRTVCTEITGGIDDLDIVGHFHCDGSEEPSASGRFAAWRADVPSIDTADDRLTAALAATADDLGALRLVDPDHPDDVVVAAGAPWFMTLFGRDALLTAYMALMVDPRIALGVLRTLARLQGRTRNDVTEEQPGRILHEVRFHERPSLRFAEGTIYYGTADATPLFVMLLGELRRWGLADDAVEDLLPAADRALEWIVRDGDLDGDGFVEYSRTTEHGLANQGWKDSWDAVRFADGRLAEGPIALCEVQGYAYAAFVARAHFAEEAGDLAAMRDWNERADRLRAEFRRKFWLADRGWFALGLDGDKQPIDALASNMGHALWSGIVDVDLAPAVAHHLLSPPMFSGWGIRTMASSMAAFNPVSYHLGSVWPHDNAICVAGLARYGFMAEAHRVMDAMLDVSDHHDGRLPELLAGLDRSELTVPAVYPTSCMPQAWAAATPLMFLRTLLGLSPSMPHRELRVSPQLPAWVHHVEIGRIPLDGQRITIVAGETEVSVSGLADDVMLRTDPREP